jgi:hypothetical protein
MFKHAAFHAVALAVAMSTISSVASAQFTTFTGWDLGASTPGVNSIAARNAFLAATGGSMTLDFESTVPSGLTITGGAIGTAAEQCNLFGCNTTPGGSAFLGLGGATRFDFATPINYFGAFFGGMQVENSLIRVFFGSGNQEVPLDHDYSYFLAPPTGGTGFYGFSSAQGISRVDVITGYDYVGLDDGIFGSSTVVPEPSTYALMAAGLVAIGVSSRRRRTQV